MSPPISPLVYFVRHGETDWNAEGRLQGQADTDISDLGRRQATRNGELLRDLIAQPETFDFVASPLRRTRETMERIRRAMGLDPLAYRTDERLKELHFGDWQGFTYAELEQSDPGSGVRRSRDKWNFVPPGAHAESYQILLERVRPFVEGIRSPSVCVTHGGIIRVLFRLIEDVPERACARLSVPQDKVLKFENGSLTWL